MIEYSVETPGENIKNFALSETECDSFLNQILEQVVEEAQELGSPEFISSARLGFRKTTS